MLEFVLLQAFPSQATLEAATPAAAWQTTVLATSAIGGILAAVLAADAAACEAALHDGSWDAAVQRTRWDPVPDPP